MEQGGCFIVYLSERYQQTSGIRLSIDGHHSPSWDEEIPNLGVLDLR